MPIKQRSFGVTLLLWMVLILSAWGVIRVVTALRAWDVLNEFDASLSPLYLSITGAGWVAVGCALLAGIWNSKAWTRPTIAISALLWLIEYWIERVFFQAPRANLPFALTCSIVVIFITWILIVLPGTISFFTKSEEHEHPVEKPTSE
ncbi:MAG: hypothetical protein IPP66_21600 [Anaerolineales bacterium]|nr:hypothetical protein [Anaerolineales bacterium]